MRQMWASPQPKGTVVVGCDGSRESQDAVVAASAEAVLRRTALVLLAVAKHRPYWPDNLTWVARAEAESARHARTAADHALAYVVATHPSLAVDIVVVSELDSPALADAARRSGLLVLGRRGIVGQVAFTMGSTSAELARRFHCPILVVHDQGSALGSEGPQRDSCVVVGVGDVNGSNDFDGILDNRGVSSVLAVAEVEAVTRNLPLIIVHTVGDPVAELLHRTGPGDLLVIGTHGHGRLAGLVHGSVSREILDKMTCDVLVVQPALVGAEPLGQPAAAHPATPTWVSGPARSVSATRSVSPARAASPARHAVSVGSAAHSPSRTPVRSRSPEPTTSAGHAGRT